MRGHVELRLRSHNFRAGIDGCTECGRNDFAPCPAMPDLTLRAFPTSVLPESPADRVALVVRLASPWTDENGVTHEPVIDAETARKLLDWTPRRSWWRRVVDWVRR